MGYVRCCALAYQISRNYDRVVSRFPSSTLIRRVEVVLEKPLSLGQQHRANEMIYRFNQTVSIDGDPAYVASVRRILDTIDGDGGMGRLLLLSLGLRFIGYRPIILGAPTGLGVTIVYDDLNFAEAQAENSGDALEDRGVPSRGSFSLVYFTPANFPTQPAGTSVRVGDATLVHELMHALRQINGISNCNVDFRDDFDSVDEFYAILIENIYRSGRSLPLRRDHRTFARLYPERVYWNEPNYRSLFTRLVSQMSDFVTAVADVAAPYNPIRDYMVSGR